MQVTPTPDNAGQKPKNKPTPPGPSLKVSAFVDLMKHLMVQKDRLTDEQVRFIQNAIQRFEHENEGQVKTNHQLPKAKKVKRASPPPTMTGTHAPTKKSKAFIERLVKHASENEALAEIQYLSDSDADRLAREQGLRANSPDIARAKLAETITTLREIERIAGAGTKNEKPK